MNEQYPAESPVAEAIAEMGRSWSRDIGTPEPGQILSWPGSRIAGVGTPERELCLESSEPAPVGENENVATSATDRDVPLTAADPFGYDLGVTRSLG